MRNLFLTIAILSSLVSCTKLFNLPDASDFTLTYRDTAVDFNDYKYFIIRDTVAIVGDEYSPDSTELSEISSIIPLVTGELLQRGFRQTDTIAKADVSINIALLATPQTSPDELLEWLSENEANDYLEWYSGGSPVWGEFEGFWYPWDYEDVTTQPGILIIEMVDAESIRDLQTLKTEGIQSSDLKLEFLWQAIISGILKTGRYDAGKGATYLDEAFLQSEYLKTEKL